MPVALSTLQERQIKLTEASGIGNEVDRNDRASLDREVEDDARLPTLRPHRACGPSDECRLPIFSTPLVSARLRRSQDS